MGEIQGIKTYDKLTELFNQVARHSFPYEEKDMPPNGIYVMFEAGEKHNALDRVVRIGSHIGQNRLFERINEHYIGHDHRDSIFRKHLGRCFLTIDKETNYIGCWDLKIKKTKDKAKNLNRINWDLEEKYENKITAYIRSKLSFILIPDLIDERMRLRLERGLIATFAQENEKTISENWIGKYHPDHKIFTSGLWNIHHVNATPLTDTEVTHIVERLRVR